MLLEGTVVAVVVLDGKLPTGAGVATVFVVAVVVAIDDVGSLVAAVEVSTGVEVGKLLTGAGVATGLVIVSAILVVGATVEVVVGAGFNWSRVDVVLL